MNTVALALIFSSISQFYNISPGLLSALCYVESNHAVHAIHLNDGGSNSVGVCQIKLRTAQAVGFRGTERELSDPTTNVYWAARYLHWQLNRYDGDILKAVSAYNAGSHRLNSQGLTINRKYVRKVFNAWADSK